MLTFSSDSFPEGFGVGTLIGVILISQSSIPQFNEPRSHPEERGGNDHRPGNDKYEHQTLPVGLWKAVLETPRMPCSISHVAGF